jgi:hypothetical protein
MEDKFRWLAGYVLDAPRLDRVVETLWRFDQIADVREWIQILS